MQAFRSVLEQFLTIRGIEDGKPQAAIQAVVSVEENIVAFDALEVAGPLLDIHHLLARNVRLAALVGLRAAKGNHGKLLGANLAAVDLFDGKISEIEARKHWLGLRILRIGGKRNLCYLGRLVEQPRRILC